MTGDVGKKISEMEKSDRLIVDNLIDAIWVVDAKTLKYEFITPSIQKICGYSAEELIGTSIVARMSPESLSKANQLLQVAREAFDKGDETDRVLELEMKHKDSSTYWVEIRARFMKKQNQPLKIVGISKDITERKLADAEQQRLIDQLKAALSEKEKFLEEIQLLSKLLPVCSGCRRIRDENGKWWPLDAYVKHKTGSDFTHTICGDCKGVFYPDQ